MTLFNAGLTIYRNTVKRIRPLHVGINRIMTSVLLPMLEQMKNFETIKDDPFWFRFELLTNRHEQETTAQFQRFVKPGMVVLDIGAHVGYYTRLSAELVGKTGRVVAVEPHPRTFEVLQRNTKNLRNVTLVQTAVAEEESTAELYDYLMMSASGSLHYDETLLETQRAGVGSSDVAPRIKEEFPVEKFTVRTVRIDDLLREQGIQQIDFVKMDIEGAEISALRGMRNTIERSTNLILVMEYNPQALQAFNLEPLEALNEIVSMGFTDVQIIDDHGQLMTMEITSEKTQHLTTQLTQNMAVVNLLFSRS